MKRIKFFKVLVLTLFFSLFLMASNCVLAQYNIDAQNYKTYGKIINSYINADEDGIRILKYEKSGDVIELKYNNNFELISEKTVESENEFIFGGYFETDKYYFLAFGQDNKEENNKKEVIKVNKYNKNWEKIGTVSIKNSNTVHPFAAGSFRMTENNGILYIRTCHEMYKDEDGYNHQSNITFSVNIENMEIVDSFFKVQNISCGYVSHSFNQFIDVVNDKLVAVDHGDAYPREIVLVLYKYLENGKFTNESKYNFCTSVPFLKIKGEIGDNTTNASVGGFESGEQNYIAAGNSINQDTEENFRNIFVSTVNINEPKEADLKWITNYTYDKNVTTPHLVKLNNDAFLIMWGEKEEENNIVKCCVIDNKGNKLVDEKKFNIFLSDCKPILKDKEVIWYTEDINQNINFFRLDISDLNNIKLVRNDISINSALLTSDKNEKYNLFEESFKVHKNDNLKLDLDIGVNWNGRMSGKIYIVQGNSKIYESVDGNFKDIIINGKFEENKPIYVFAKDEETNDFSYKKLNLEIYEQEDEKVNYDIFNTILDYNSEVINIVVENNTDTEIEGKCIGVLFDKNGKFKNIISENVNLNKNENRQINFLIDNNILEGDIIKIFLWKDFYYMNPISNINTINFK